MRRRLSPLSVAVWLGVLVVMVLSVVLVHELSQAVGRSQQAITIANVNGLYGAARDAQLRQDQARDRGDQQAHAAAAQQLQAALGYAGGLHPAAGPRARRLAGG